MKTITYAKKNRDETFNECFLSFGFLHVSVLVIEWKSLILSISSNLTGLLYGKKQN